MNRYIYQIYSKGRMQGTFDLITNAGKAAAEKAALRHALTLYPSATVKSIKGVLKNARYGTNYRPVES